MKNYVYKSLALHIAVALMFTLNLPLFWSNRDTSVSQVPIIVDLKDIKISEMTNLPPKAKFDKEDRVASTIKRKENENFSTPEAKKPDNTPAPKEDVKATEPEEKVDDAPATPPKQDFLVAPTPKPEKAKTANIRPSVKPKAPTPPKTADKAAPKKDDKTQLANPLKSLLASVDSLEKNIGATNQQATIKEGTKVSNMGIEGGTGGSYFSELSISEIDAIAGRLRACWNLDPGAKGAQNMIVELRAYLNQDGSVKDVKILNGSRYNSDPHFRSVADSARRAVYVCGERDRTTNRNAYSILSEKYSERYDSWNTMLLRFNPLDGNIN